MLGNPHGNGLLSVRGHLKLSEGYRSKLRSAAIVQQGEKVEGCKSMGDSNSSLPPYVGKGGFFSFFLIRNKESKTQKKVLSITTTRIGEGACAE